MYVRPPNPDRHKIKVPENYSGNAFIQESRANEMPPPVRQLPSLYDLPSTAPNESVEANENVEDFDSIEEIEPVDTTSDKEEENLIPVSASQKKSEKNSIFSSLLPPGVDFSSRFPFGHGIGREEVIILAVMLLVYLSGDDDGCDHELILLLGLLLLAG